MLKKKGNAVQKGRIEVSCNGIRGKVTEKSSFEGLNWSLIGEKGTKGGR